VTLLLSGCSPRLPLPLLPKNRHPALSERARRLPPPRPRPGVLYSALSRVGETRSRSAASRRGESLGSPRINKQQRMTAYECPPPSAGRGGRFQRAASRSGKGQLPAPPRREISPSSPERSTDAIADRPRRSPPETSGILARDQHTAIVTDLPHPIPPKRRKPAACHGGKRDVPLRRSERGNYHAARARSANELCARARKSE